VPKLPGGVTKSKRQQALREVLNRWGSLEKGQIDQCVAQFLGIQQETIRKALYEDLKELVDSGEIVVSYFNPDGSSIEDYDPAVHKSSKGKWAIPRAEGQVSGAGALSLQGAELIVSNVLKNDVRVDSGAHPAETGHTHIFFNLNSYFFSIRINSQMLPASLILCRTNDQLLGSPLKLNGYFKDLEADFGRRLILLVVPSTGVSAPKPPERLGHMSLEIKSPNDALLRDLGSSNGTEFIKLTQGEADDLIHDGSVIGTRTVTRSWNHQPLDSGLLTRCEPHSINKIAFPAIIQASDSFRLLVVT
jgi:hypothetical protein